MRINLPFSQRRQLTVLLVLLGMAVLAACSPLTGSASINQEKSPQGTLRTPLQKPTRTATRTPISSPTPTKIFPTATPKPTGIPPSRFETDRLYQGVEPVSYIDDVCQYYYDRWNPENAAPGTIVVPVMYHGINKRPVAAGDNISIYVNDFLFSMEKAHKLGFESITMQQLDDFLHHNAYIPPRSLLLIIDDRRLGTVREHFLPVLEEYDWTLTMAYITGVINEQEWAKVKEMVDTGYTEVQAHGYLHNGETYITQWTTEEMIRTEIFAPIPAIEEHLGKRPIAYIWPGGNYSQLSVDLADEAGYDLGFTVFARGPLMYNWIPLGEADRKVNNPLLVLPRYWSTTLYKNLDFAVELSEDAKAQAERQKVDEIKWYQSNCGNNPPLLLPSEERFSR